jgi:Family of unknown function (DUF5996)
MKVTRVEKTEPTRRPVWPTLATGEGVDAYRTLHLWTQIVGKIRLASSAPLNHWWGATLYVTARGLTTSTIPYGSRTFQIDFDFCAHELRIVTSGANRSVGLYPRSVADFYSEVTATLDSMGLPVRIWTMPMEIPDPVPFQEDHEHGTYDRDEVHRLWQALVQAERIMRIFACRFIGKASPVHFFWGGFDLAVTRFSGRRAPEHPSVPWMADRVTREAYSHEVSSCGLWPGTAEHPAMFYAYAYPEPPGFSSAPIRPDAASYNSQLSEFILPYHALQSEADPDESLLGFFQTGYEAAADHGNWDRAELER